MSSILNALKKVEGGHPKYIHVRSWPRRIDAKKAISSRARSAWFVNQLVTVVLVALIFLGVGYYLIEKKPMLVSKILSDPALKRDTPKPVISRNESVPEVRHVAVADLPVESAAAETPLAAPVEAIVPEEADHPEIAPDAYASTPAVPDLPPKFVEKPPPMPVEPRRKPVQPRRKSVEPRQTSVQPKRKTEPRQASVQAKRKTEPRQASVQPKRKTEPRQITEPKRKIDEPRPNEALPLETPDPVETETVAKIVEKTEAETPPPSASEYAQTEESGEDIGLTLQALVWSDDAASSFAVIDDVIVRKGGKVKGYTVKLIGKKHVVVGKNKKRWTIKFQ